jgi:hypothetical protein
MNLPETKDIRRLDNPTPDAIVDKMILNAQGENAATPLQEVTPAATTNPIAYAARTDTPTAGKKKKYTPLPGDSLPNVTLSQEFRQALRIFVAQSNGSVATLQTSLEGWYNDGNDRISGWYKRKTQVYLFGIGFVVAVLTNADTLHMRTAIENNHTMRAAIIAAAQNVSSQSALPGDRHGTPGVNGASHALVTIQSGDLDNIPLPLGWSKTDTVNLGKLFYFSHDPSNFSPAKFIKCLWKLVGWFLTAAAISLGSPFWFDTLKRIMNVRAGGKPTDKKPDSEKPSAPGGTAPPPK